MWPGGTSRIQQRRMEVCHYVPALRSPLYHDVLGKIFRLLSENDVELTIWNPGPDESITGWDPDNIRPPGVTLPLGNGVRCLSVLWDLAHELGHLFLFDFGRAFPSDPPWFLTPPKRCARSKEEAREQLSHEAAAWDAAEGYLTNTLTLLHNGTLRGDFHRRRESCLDTYRKKVLSFGGRSSGSGSR